MIILATKDKKKKKNLSNAVWFRFRWSWQYMSIQMESDMRLNDMISYPQSKEKLLIVFFSSSSLSNQDKKIKRIEWSFTSHPRRWNRNKMNVDDCLRYLFKQTQYVGMTSDGKETDSCLVHFITDDNACFKQVVRVNRGSIIIFWRSQVHHDASNGGLIVVVVVLKLTFKYRRMNT